MVTVVGYENGQLTGRSALPDLRWAYPITWLVQVMPLFFLVGGFANAASLTSHRRRGQCAGDWLIHRGARLIRPTSALVAALAVGAVLARIAGVDPSLVRLAVWFAAIPLWFLSAYLIVVAVTPAMYALHQRYGIAVPLILLGLVAGGDLARIHAAEGWGNGNFVFGWLAIHQVGFFWRDGRLPSRPRTILPLLAGSFIVVLVLTIPGPYPISMINVPGERLQNMSPPSLALLALFAVQLALALLVRDRVERWLHRIRPWTAVIAINSVILTIFLWHITAAILVTATLHVLDVLPTPAAGSAAWFAWRIPWLLMLTAVLAILVAIFGRIEIRGGQRLEHRSRWLPAAIADLLAQRSLRLALAVLGFVAVAFGLLDNSLLPRREPALFGFPAVALVFYSAGAIIHRLLRATPQAGDGSP